MYFKKPTGDAKSIKSMETRIQFNDSLFTLARRKPYSVYASN
jgi:hypothetical protein